MSSLQQDKPIRGRGTEHNPTNRFERLAILPDPDAEILPESEQIQPRTHFFRDSSKSVIAYNSSPDVGFTTSFNPYRGCDSITTLKKELTRIMEPRTAVPKMRLAAIETMAKAGVPVGVMVAPVIPGLTDEEMPGILKAAANAGAITAGYVPVRLPFGVKELFEKWLQEHMPDRKDKVLNRIRSIRGGKLNDSDFHTRMRGFGVFAEQMEKMFDIVSRKAGIPFKKLDLCTAKFNVPTYQL